MALEEIRSEKVKKINELRSSGVDPYPATSHRSHTIQHVLESFSSLSQSQESVTVAGRVIAIREHGGSAFFNVDDGFGRMQGHIKEDGVGADLFAQFKDYVAIGDIIEVSGPVFETKRGEKTIETQKYALLTKALLPLPEKWHGLQDVEERLRRRYVDLIMNPEERDVFRKKSLFWQTIRQFLLDEGGLEVETPVLELIPGGADAEPFKTHLNALDIDMYLRISLELNLKRLIVGGYEKVFEIGRIFRNEGIDREHLQDYTQMEMYWAYHDYRQLMAILHRMYQKTIHAVLGGYTHKYQDHEIDWSGEWPEIDYYEVFEKYTGIDLTKATEEELKAYAHKEHIDTEAHAGRGRIIDVIFKKKVRPMLIQPSFLVRPPVDVEPLAKRWPKDLNRVERFQIVAGGTELGKGFSELNDPLDQRARFEEQVKMREAGDKEAQMMDEDFVEALEYGMPPTAGFGISERLFAFLMDRPVRETVFFPLMRPRD